MVKGRVEEDTTIVPRSRFDANGFVNETTLTQCFVRYRDRCSKVLSGDLRLSDGMRAYYVCSITQRVIHLYSIQHTSQEVSRSRQALFAVVYHTTGLQSANSAEGLPYRRRKYHWFAQAA